MDVGLILGLLLTYVFSSVVIFLAAARLTGGMIAPGRLFFLVVGFGPVSISLLLTFLCQIAPGRQDAFYVTAITGVFAALGAIGARKWRLLVELVATLRSELAWLSAPAEWPARTLLLAVGVSILLATLVATCTPLSANDPLEYCMVARIMHRHHQIVATPFSEADPETGFFWASSHPMGYPSLILWSYMIQGNDLTPGAMRWIAPVYSLHTILLLWHLLANRGLIFGPVAMFLFVGNELWFSLTGICHVDPMRVYLFFLAFAWAAETVRCPRPTTLVLGGISVGLSIFSHSIGILTLPFFAVVYFLTSGNSIGQRVGQVAVVSVVAVLVGGQRYVENCIRHGTPVSDSCIATAMPKLEYAEYVRRDRGLTTPWRRLVDGALCPLTSPRLFGFSNWLLPVAIVAGFRSIRHDRLAFGFLGVIVLFYAMVAISMVAGTDLVIKNCRYSYTLQPFVCYHVGLFLGTGYERFVPS